MTWNDPRVFKLNVALVTLVMFGAALAERVAVAVVPVPPFVELTAPVRFTNEPPLETVTSMVTTQLPFEGIVPFVELTELDPTVKPERVEPQVLFEVRSVTVMPVGKVSVMFTPVNGVAFELENVSVIVEGLPAVIDVGLKALAIPGGPTTLIAVLIPDVNPVAAAVSV